MLSIKSKNTFFFIILNFITKIRSFKFSFIFSNYFNIIGKLEIYINTTELIELIF